MALIDELERIDRRRQWLAIYEERARRMWFLPGLRNRFLNRFARRWHEATAKRERILALINADPVTRDQLRQREAKKLRAAQVRSAGDIAKDLRGLEGNASKVVKLQREELRAREAWQDAVWYYKSGAWKEHRLDVDEVTTMLDRFKEHMVLAARTRAREQAQLEHAVAGAFAGQPEHLLHRERLLEQAGRELALREPASMAEGRGRSDFEVWLKRRVPSLHAPAREKTRERDRDRER